MGFAQDRKPAVDAGDVAPAAAPDAPPPAPRADSAPPAPAPTQPSTPSPSSPTATAEPAKGAIVFVRVTGDPVDRDTLRRELERTLGARIVFTAEDDVPGSSGKLTLALDRARGELAITWDSPEHHTTTRVIEARGSDALLAEDAALIAASLREPSPTAPIVREEKPAPAPPAERPAKTAPLVASLFHPIATNLGSPYQSAVIEVNLLHGRIGELRGFQLGTANVVDGTGGKASGRADGLQLAPFGANIVTGDARGFGYAFAANWVGGDMEGARAAWVFNGTKHDARGVEGTFGMNYVGGKLSGGTVGLVNLAGDVDGGQLGLVNIAKRVRGAQIGIVTIADDVEGVALAPIAVTRTGGVHPMGWASTATFANFGVKFATRYTYTIFSGHYHADSPTDPTSMLAGYPDGSVRGYDPMIAPGYPSSHSYWGPGFFFGAKIPTIERLSITTDIGATWLFAPVRTAATTPSGQNDSYHEHRIQPRIRAAAHWQFLPHFSMFFGGGAVADVRLLLDGEQGQVRVIPEAFGGIEL